MNDVVLIATAEQNIFDFELDIEGIVSKNVTVNFVIQTDDVDLSYKCERQSNNYHVTIPKIDILTRPSYNYRIEVIIDDIYFKPHVGIVTMAQEANVVSAPTNRAIPVTDTPKKKPAKLKKPKNEEAVKKEPVKEEPVKEEPVKEEAEQFNNIDVDAAIAQVEAQEAAAKPKPINPDKLKLVLKEVEANQKARRDEKARIMRDQRQVIAVKEAKDEAARKATNDKIKAALNN